MFFKSLPTLLIAFCGLVGAAGYGSIEEVVTPGSFAAEFFLKDSTEYESPLSLKGSDWLLAANFFAGGGAVMSEALADTVNPRGYLGARLHGYKDSVDFALNLLFDNFTNRNLKQFKALQYTGHMGYRHDWIQVKLGHEAEHFGPGVYNNLTFNRSAYAYDRLSVNLDLGPLRVYSFYGSLRVAPWDSDSSFADRDVYGHRYEINTKNFTFGVNEATVLFDNNKPWHFVPTVPLFMEKGQFSEDTNNGELSFDAEFRFLGLGRVYTEFLLDDMESPISLIRNDNVEAKWGWMAGIQLDKDFEVFGQKLHAGTVAEYARVEPFVFTHFKENTAQIAHAGKPLGAPNGANSQVIDWSIYAQFSNRIKAVVHNKWLWKGIDYGSHLNDITPYVNHMKIPKSFIKGAKMQYSLAPYFTYTVNHVSYQLGLRIFNEQEAFGNVVVWW